jgi:hypothetical protein
VGDDLKRVKWLGKVVKRLPVSYQMVRNLDVQKKQRNLFSEVIHKNHRHIMVVFSNNTLHLGCKVWEVKDVEGRYEWQGML